MSPPRAIVISQIPQKYCDIVLLTHSLVNVDGEYTKDTTIQKLHENEKQTFLHYSFPTSVYVVSINV